MVEPQPSKLMMRVRFPLPAPKFADMAQSVERILGKDEVPSSTLGISTTIKKPLRKLKGFFLWLK